MPTASSPSMSPPSMASKRILTATKAVSMPEFTSRPKVTLSSQSHSSQRKPRGFPNDPARRKNCASNCSRCSRNARMARSLRRRRQAFKGDHNHVRQTITTILSACTDPRGHAALILNSAERAWQVALSPKNALMERLSEGFLAGHTFPKPTAPLSLRNDGTVVGFGSGARQRFQCLFVQAERPTGRSNSRTDPAALDRRSGRRLFCPRLPFNESSTTAYAPPRIPSFDCRRLLQGGGGCGRAQDGLRPDLHQEQQPMERQAAFAGRRGAVSRRDRTHGHPHAVRA